MLGQIKLWPNSQSGRGRGTDKVACRRVKEREVRYGREHKQATRRRIIEAAGRRFKRDGIDGSGSPRSWRTPG